MVDSLIVGEAPFRPLCARGVLVFSLASTLVACELAIKTNDLEGGCPGHLPGPALVKVPVLAANDAGQATSASGAYCVDSTEVTNAHYKAFVDAQSLDAQAQFDRPGCAAATSYLPDQSGWPEPGSDDLPVVQVNWCQAAQYCSWAGKRLCGRIGGGPLLDEFTFDASVSQWFNACSRGGVLPFPYGDTFDPAICWGPGHAWPNYVAKQRGCEGGFPGLFDMSGNVWEWTDTCGVPGGDMDFCRAFGGAFDSSPPDEFACGIQFRAWTRTAGAANIGFRCCKDL